MFKPTTWHHYFTQVNHVCSTVTLAAGGVNTARRHYKWLMTEYCGQQYEYSDSETRTAKPD